MNEQALLPLEEKTVLFYEGNYLASLEKPGFCYLLTDIAPEKSLASGLVVTYEDEVTAVVVARNNRREIYAPLRPICDYLGVDWSTQRQRVNHDPVLSKHVSGVVITPTPSEDSLNIRKI